MRAFFSTLGLLLFAFGCAEGTAPAGGAGGGTTSNAAGGNGGDATGAGGPSGGGVSQGGDGNGGVATTDGGGGSGTGAHGGEGGGGALEQACPANEFATGFDAGGVIQCAPIEPSVVSAVNNGCDIFYGIRDGCGACSDPPTKWGRVNGATCANGVGADNTCSSATIGGQNVGLFGLNADGDVDDNDKLYAGFMCDAGVPDEGPGPCDSSGEAVVGYDGAQVTCAKTGAAALDYMRASCSLYVGWRDTCGACTDAPSKWGYAGSQACSAGSGAGNTCVSTVLGGETVPLLGIDFDGDVDENDKLYFGLHCAGATEASGPQPVDCPDGQFLVGTHADGTVECESPAPQIAAYVAQHCTAYIGFRDSCGACTTMPAKYGRVREGFCSNDAGVDNTCTTANLAGQAVSLFGLSTDGNVNDDDKLYIGFKCD
ncbi:MAG: hypothetical protein HOW73_31680 [Polyangiaceae bacterium]|nr:hypothetical protein [Polyangiaceae bacterium]